MPLSSDQLTDIRADIGDTNNAFSNAELQRLYERASESYEGTVLLAIDQLLMNASKLADFTSGESSERRSQIFDQLTKVRALWAGRTSSKKQKVVFARLGTPNKRKSSPNA